MNDEGYAWDEPLPCKHWWAIAPAGHGPTSAGRCIKCGALKEFSNIFERDSKSYQSTIGSSRPKSKPTKPYEI